MNDDIPKELAALAKEVSGKSYEAAKRLVVSKVGSVRRGAERFDDDVADAVFHRLQRNAQVGRYASEEVLRGLGRNARRLDGEGRIELFRSAPRGTGIRPGDFVADTAHEVGFYAHGGNVVHRLTVARADVFRLDGAAGRNTCTSRPATSRRSPWSTSPPSAPSAPSTMPRTSLRPASRWRPDLAHTRRRGDAPGLC